MGKFLSNFISSKNGPVNGIYNYTERQGKGENMQEDYSTME